MNTSVLSCTRASRSARGPSAVSGVAAPVCPPVVQSTVNSRSLFATGTARPRPDAGGAGSPAWRRRSRSPARPSRGRRRRPPGCRGASRRTPATSATVASSACPAWMVRSALLACANSSMRLLLDQEEEALPVAGEDVERLRGHRRRAGPRGRTRRPGPPGAARTSPRWRTARAPGRRGRAASSAGVHVVVAEPLGQLDEVAVVAPALLGRGPRGRRGRRRGRPRGTTSPRRRRGSRRAWSPR